MPKTIHFNTGRRYASDGQRITATLHDDGVVTFMDHSRGIDGAFEYSGFDDRRAIQSAVLHAYDRNLAKSTPRSWEDGMLRDGCNAWRDQ